MRWLAAAGLLLLHAHAVRADDGAQRLRFSVHAGLPTLFVSEVTVNDRVVETSSVRTSFEAELRFELPLLRPLVAGARVMPFMWRVRSEDRLGYYAHVADDIGLMGRARLLFPGTANALHELYAGLPFGLTIDSLSERYHPSAEASERIDTSLGFHLGLIAGYQQTWSDSAFGYSVETGFIYHRVAKTFEYVGGSGGAAVDEVVYAPMLFLARFGLVILLPD